ncbi:MAG: OmpA family protein [Methylococcales bacterium]|nr:OmpA family protein [Methylococcales bacterium]MDD5631443.1 OmpA family protein [Methylococcales bacterium]
MKTQYLLFCLLGIMALTKIAYADETYFGKTKPSTNQVIEALSPAAKRADDAGFEDGTNQNGKSRSIDMSSLEGAPRTDKKKIKKIIHKALQTANTEAAMSMEIFFGYNSAELTDIAKDYLKPVGEAMASEKLQGLDFVVEGHTDAVGGYAYNKNLSEERAKSVKRFLVDVFHIEPYRIQIIGKGKSELLDPKNPQSEVNRRVRIVATK